MNNKHMNNEEKESIKNGVMISGTGGDKKGTFNISSSTMIISSIMGIKCCKIGGSSYTSKSGSLEFLKNILRLEKINNNRKIIYKKTNILFIEPKEIFFKELIGKKIYKARKSIGKITILNYLFSLINPLKIRNQIIGIKNGKRRRIIFNECLKEENINNIIIYNSKDNMDELSIFNKNKIYILKNKNIIKTFVDPNKIGFKNKEKRIKNIKSKNVKNSIKIFKDAIYNKNKEARNTLILNCSLILIIKGYTRNFKESCLVIKNIFKKKIKKLFKKFKKILDVLEKNNKK